jgi:hypothetical protein
VQVASSHGTIHRVTRLLRAATLCLLLGAVLSGCATVTATSTFEINGDATHSLALVIPIDSITEADMPRFRRALDDAEERASEDGLDVQHVETPTQLGVHISSSTREASNAPAALNSLVNSLLGTPDTGPIVLFQGTYERTNPAVGGNEFSLSMTVDGDAIRAAFDQVLPAASLQLAPQETVSISYSATMPGKIRDTNGERINESTVRWAIPLQGATTMEATSSVGKNTPWAWLVLTVIAAIGGVAIITLIATRLLIERRRALRELAPRNGMLAPINLRASIGRAVNRAIYGRGAVRVSPTLPEDQEIPDGTDAERD